MERASVHPRDNERTIIGQGPVDVNGGQAGRPGADGQPEPPLVLTLDGQQTVDDSNGVPGRRPSQQLGGQAISDHR
jgi:hypothetical protein